MEITKIRNNNDKMKKLNYQDMRETLPSHDHIVSSSSK